MADDLLSPAGALLDEAVELRRRIHRHPEIGLDNPRTREVIADALEGLPLTIEEGERCTSLVATLDGEHDGPTVLLRADTDGLPMPEDTGLPYASEVDGAMHACGHDAHVAMLVGAARLLADRRSELAGRVRLVFQPGEEGHHGARVMLEEGLLEHGERPAFAFAIHQFPTFRSGTVSTRPGPLMASADVLDIAFTGRGGHASSPSTCLDPIPAACEFVTAVQALVTRRVDPFDPAVVTITKMRAGTANNVIPETALLAGTIRTVSARTRAMVQDRLRTLAEGIAAAHGLTARFAIEPGYPVTVNDGEAATRAARIAADLVGAGAVRELPTPVMGAEDFSYLLEQVPGAMVFLGTRPRDVARDEAAPNHSNRMLLDEDAMATGIALHTAVALDVLGP